VLDALDLICTAENICHCENDRGIDARCAENYLADSAVYLEVL
jgi:hypothetical protein